MADKDQVRKDEENLKNTPEEAQVTELDDKDLDEASGGAFSQEEELADTNNNCLC
jgi:hypothetical protein